MNASVLNRTELPRALAENWWLLLLRGINAIALGFLAFFWPSITPLTLTLLWGVYALVDGILAQWVAVTGTVGDGAARWWLAVIGVAGVFSGLLAFFSPGVTTLVLLIFIASWSTVVGLVQIVGAAQLRNEIQGKWLLALNGLLSIALGVILMIRPDAGALAVIWIIGWYAILTGFLSICLAFRLKAHKPA
jgi:uncharacterized membrane protein HdeD (DUF308 family)